MATIRIWCLFWLALLSGPAARSQESGEVNVPRTQVIGHAGSGFFTLMNPINFLPSNSLKGISLALNRGADGVEIDVQLSQDGVPIVFHNTNLSSSTNARSGCISTSSAGTIVGLKYRGGWPYDWFHDEKPQRLDSILTHLKKRPKFPILHLDLHEEDECTPYSVSRSQNLVQQIGVLLTQLQIPRQQLVIISTRVETLLMCRQALPACALGLEVTENFEVGLAKASKNGFTGLIVPKRLITLARCQQIQQAGIQAIIFGGRSGKTIKRLLVCRPEALEIDNIPRCLRLRANTSSKASIK